MNCPNCNIIINSINELHENDQNNLIYKFFFPLEEEPLTCPKCRAIVQINILKEVETIFFVVALVCFLMLLVIFYYSTITFTIIILVSVISLKPIKNFIVTKYCELAIKTHNK